MALGVGLSISLFPMSLVVAGVSLVVAVRAGHGRWWGLTAVAGAVGFLMGVTSGGWALPTSFFDFAPAVLVGWGGLGALVGGILRGIGSRRRWSPRWGSAILEAAVGLALVAVASSAYLSFLNRPTVVLQDGRRAAVVEMRADTFLPERIVGKTGERVAVLVRNRDWYGHTFTVGKLGVDVYVGPLAERLVELPGRSGEYVLTCEVTGHEEMRGTVRITEGG